LTGVRSAEIGSAGISASAIELSGVVAAASTGLITTDLITIGPATPVELVPGSIRLRAAEPLATRSVAADESV
jgi:hypothetical protein